MSHNAVKVGVSERELEAKGIDCDSESVLPKLPDLVGYVLGLLLIWLGYTGYQLVAKAMEKPIATISQEAGSFKATVEELAAGRPVPESEASAGAPVAQVPEVKQSGSWSYRLEKVNNVVNQASQYVAGSIGKAIFSEDDDSAAPRPMADPRPEHQRKRSRASR